MPNATPSVVSPLTGKYLTVELGREFYCVAVGAVREIIRLQKITPVPHLPEYVRGVINLRGRVIPVLDLRIKFGFAAEFTDRTCIVVVQVNPTPGVILSMGLIVDGVDEVATITAAEIEPTPEFGCQIDVSCILGMANVKGRVKTLLWIERVVAPDHVAAVTAIG